MSPYYLRACAAAILLAAALPVRGQFFGDYNHPEFTVQHDPSWNDQKRQGQCTIRITVDNQVNAELRWDKLRLVTVAGQAGRDGGSVCDAPMPQSGVSNVQFQKVEGRGQMSLLEPPGPNNEWAAIVRIVDKNSGEGNYAYRLSWQWDGTMPQTTQSQNTQNRDTQNNRNQRRGGNARARNNSSTQRMCRQALAARLKQEWGAVVVNYERGNQSGNQGSFGNAAVAGRANIRAGNERRQVEYQCAAGSNSNQVQQVYYDFVGERFPWNPQLSGSETPPAGADTNFNIIPACQELIRGRVINQLGASNVSFRDISRKWWEGNVQRVNGRASATVQGRTQSIDYNCTAQQGMVQWGDFRVLNTDGSN